MPAASWSITGSGGQPILGNVHEPPGEPLGAILIAHGFKGYKDYGMFPAVAAACAGHGLVAHRFNFSHSGMTSEIETFARPDLFEQDTFNKQVADLRTVAEAVAGGRLSGTGLPQIWFGHSRGGATVLLAAGRAAGARGLTQPAGLVTAAAPCTCNPLSPEEARRLLAEGHLESPSARTGQMLRIGRASLQEQLDAPEDHDLPALARHIRCPILVIHGEKDPTVPPASADAICAAAPNARRLIIAGADHVFNTPNPLPPDHIPSPQLAALLDATIAFALHCSGH